MPYITATTKPVYLAAQAGGVTYYSDIMEVGGKCGIPQTFTAITDTDSNAYLGKMEGKGGTYAPLPATGELCEAGKIYGYNGGQVICRQTHNRTLFEPSLTPALFSVYIPNTTEPMLWIANEPVMVGMVRTYNGRQYKCLQAHTTQTDWMPPAVPALWSDVTPPTTSEWAYPVAYKVNGLVTYQGLTYKCLQAHTSQAAWTPIAEPALWQKQ
jgi:hypothetical protein